MTTVSTLAVPLWQRGTLLATLNVTVSDHDVSVDAQAQAVSVTPGVAGTYKLAVHITSDPKRGSGKSIDASTTATLTAAQAISLPVGPVPYHRYKDFEGGVAGHVYASIELLKQSGAAWNRVAVGSGSFLYTAAGAARTDQAYAIQNQSMVASTDAPTAASLQPLFDNMADLFGSPAAGQESKNLWKFPALWFLYETARGVYDTAGYVAHIDALFGYAQARNIGVYAMLAGAPPTWAVASPPYGTATGVIRGTTYTYVKGGAPPDSWTDLTDFVTWFVNRYVPLGLKVVGMPNEPNTSNYSVTTAQWATYMSHIYDAVKAAQPTVEVHAPQLSMSDTAYMDALYASGSFAGKYDKIGWHPYPLTTAGQREMIGSYIFDERVPMPGLEYIDSPMAAGSFIDSVRAHDAAARFWVSETGVATGLAAATAPPPGAGAQWTVSEARQADQWTYKLRGLARVPLVDGVTIWGLLDEATARGAFGGSNYGLMRNDRVSKKPAYAAVKNTLASIRAGTG